MVCIPITLFFENGARKEREDKLQGQLEKRVLQPAG